jgi:hypothetical protein
MSKVLLYIGGIFTLAFAVLHLSFWKMGNWAEELAKLTPDNSGIMQMLTVGSIYMLLFAAFMSFYLAHKKEKFTFVEKAWVIFIAGYYLMRIAFALPFFGFSVSEVVIWIICLVVAACYLFALRQK